MADVIKFKFVHINVEKIQLTKSRAVFLRLCISKQSQYSAVLHVDGDFFVIWYKMAFKSINCCSFFCLKISDNVLSDASHPSL